MNEPVRLAWAKVFSVDGWSGELRVQAAGTPIVADADPLADDRSDDQSAAPGRVVELADAEVFGSGSGTRSSATPSSRLVSINW